MPKITNKEIMDEIVRLAKLLEGDPSNRHDLGLIGDVKKNSSFRRQAQKMFWTIFLLMIGGNAPIFYFGSKLLAKTIIGDSP